VFDAVRPAVIVVGADRVGVAVSIPVQA
jgi:hypothetical protein